MSKAKKATVSIVTQSWGPPSSPNLAELCVLVYSAVYTSLEATVKPLNLLCPGWKVEQEPGLTVWPVSPEQELRTKYINLDTHVQHQMKN